MASTACATELKTFYKDPDATLDYIWDWSDWLGDDGDTLSSHIFTSSHPLELTVEISEHSPQTATVWLKGGLSYSSYKVTCHVQTFGGRTEDRTAQFICTNR